MARPTIGIFGALMALGGFLAVRYVQNRRGGQFSPTRELNRWENEGGAVASPTTVAADVAPAGHGSNGSGQLNGESRAWPFPRS
ncbi:hypothetical protein LJ656_27495 [Paraburkholderia sp. MMS20-SJTR3]|uniref:Uncharacterized protein n=1 Tax=Paraburkholderia sejongensis TaxID=2886946 RepID=A0ABS8K2G3_9BURK|nr:hypothetical protein [Paraburkholderia sp. MMS20-SJTR3]MCC8396340.1 hypothetical protein [Paraburkholderia sp. MMS20-SJTR3]